LPVIFGDEKLIEQTERVIEEEMPAVSEARQMYQERCRGKKVMLFVGGSRAHHYQELFKELGMEVVAAGYEFAHRDDYEGRRVLPSITVDADSRNIEELTVEKDPERYKERVSPEKCAELAANGVEFKDYAGMMPEMEAGSLTIDEPSHHETFRLLELYKPDLYCAGVKEKYAVQKTGIPCLQLHSYDYGGPFAGFEGAINFYKDVDRLVSSRIWSYLEAPWQRQTQVKATYGI